MRLKVLFQVFAGLMGFALAVVNIYWHQWQFYVPFIVALVWANVGRLLGEQTGAEEGKRKVADMQKYLDHIKAYYADQLTKLGHKEKIL